VIAVGESCAWSIGATVLNPAKLDDGTAVISAASAATQRMLGRASPPRAQRVRYSRMRVIAAFQWIRGSGLLTKRTVMPRLCMLVVQYTNRGPRLRRLRHHRGVRDICARAPMNRSKSGAKARPRPINPSLYLLRTDVRLYGVFGVLLKQ